MGGLLEDVLSINIGKGAKEAFLGHEEELGCNADATKASANPTGSAGARVTPHWAEKVKSLYTSINQSLDSGYDLGQDVSFQRRAIPGVAGVRVVLCCQLPTLLVAEGGSGRNTTATTTPQFFSHENMCKNHQKDRDLFSVFCTFKMLIDMAQFLSRKLESIYTSTSNV